VYLGGRHGATVSGPKDNLYLLGKIAPLMEIRQRRTDAGGDQAHQDAIDAHKQTLRGQD